MNKKNWNTKIFSGDYWATKWQGILKEFLQSVKKYKPSGCSLAESKTFIEHEKLMQFVLPHNNLRR